MLSNPDAPRLPFALPVPARLGFVGAVLAVLVAFACGSCASGDEDVKGTRQESRATYQHTAQFLLEESAELLEETWSGIESIDVNEKKLVTVWEVHLHPQAEFGYRERLIVTLEGDPGAYKVVATEETEFNKEQRLTLVLEEAEWKPRSNVGARAQAFLLALRLRLKPA